MQTILQLADGCAEQRQCMVHQLGEGQGMDQCTMGLDIQMSEQDPVRQGTSNHMCARMENSQVVVHTTTNDIPSSSTTAVCAPKHFHKSRGSNYAESTLGNPFFGGAWMTTLTQLRNHLRMLECQGSGFNGWKRHTIDVQIPVSYCTSSKRCAESKSQEQDASTQPSTTSNH